MQASDRNFRIVHQRGLGDLEREITRVQTGLVQDRHDVGDELRIGELARRQIHGDREPLLRVALLPNASVAARLGEHLTADLDDETVLLRDRDEVVRRHEPARRVLPADECLERDHPVLGERDDRLVLHDELVFLQGSAQVGLELEPGDRRRVHLGLVDPEATLALALGAVHRGVGVAEQLVGGGAVRAGVGDARARMDEDLLARDEEGRFERVDQPLRGLAGGRGCREPLQQDRELVAAEPRRGVGAAQHRLESQCDVHEEPVADGVPEAVVDGLERVEVDEEHGGGVIAPALPHCVVDPIGEERTVRQVRERVVERLVAELGFEAVALRHVLNRDEHRGAPEERELVRVHLHIDPPAVLQLMAPDAGSLHLRALDRELGEEALGLVVGVHVTDEPVEELLARVAVVVNRRFVHLEERQGAGVVDPHRLRVVEEELARVRFTRAELQLAGAQLGLAPLLGGGRRAEQVQDERDAQRRQHCEPVHVGRGHVRVDPPQRDRELAERHANDDPGQGGSPHPRADLFEEAGDHERVADRQGRPPADGVDDERDGHDLHAEQRPELAVRWIGAPQTERDLGHRCRADEDRHQEPKRECPEHAEAVQHDERRARERGGEQHPRIAPAGAGRQVPEPAPPHPARSADVCSRLRVGAA